MPTARDASGSEGGEFPFVYAWANTPAAPDGWRMRCLSRQGDRCKVLAHGSKNTILIEFEDGFQVTTSRNALRKATNQQQIDFT